VAGKRVLWTSVLVWIVLVTVACAPQWVWDWLPFGPGGDCRALLDEDTLNRLRFGMDASVQMQPGETREFSLGVVECCYYFEPVDACATYSVDPTEGATIDAETGLFTVERGTPSGEVFTITADVENGRRLVSVEVHVYTPQSNPLVGIWREEAQLACDTFEDVVPEERIGELRFDADGSFSVTWMPFEIYRDYWGSYRFDLERQTLDLANAGGNYVPEDVDGSGSFLIDDQGRLVLKDMWLGTPHGGSGVAHCGHRFAR
jgi:hypothetical protein